MSDNPSSKEQSDSYQNGMSRVAYFIYSSILFLVGGIFQFAVIPDYWLIPVLICVAINSFLVIRRVRDFDGSAISFVILSLIPYVNGFVWLYLVFKSGKKAVFAAAKQDKLRKKWEEEARNNE